MATLEKVEGIGPTYGAKLRKAGVRSTGDLLKKGATRSGRKEIEDSSEVSGKMILEWVNHVDLFRIKGVGEEYADLLEAAGVDTVPELAQRNPDNLYEHLVKTNDDKRLVRKLPTRGQVANWVAQAKALPRVVEY